MRLGPRGSARRAAVTVGILLLALASGATLLYVLQTPVKQVYWGVYARLHPLKADPVQPGRPLVHNCLPCACRGPPETSSVKRFRAGAQGAPLSCQALTAELCSAGDAGNPVQARLEANQREGSAGKQAATAADAAAGAVRKKTGGGGGTARELGPEDQGAGQQGLQADPQDPGGVLAEVRCHRRLWPHDAQACEPQLLLPSCCDVHCSRALAQQLRFKAATATVCQRQLNSTEATGGAWCRSRRRPAARGRTGRRSRSSKKRG